jgi:hypothetical protein
VQIFGVDVDALADVVRDITKMIACSALLQTSKRVEVESLVLDEI